MEEGIVVLFLGLGRGEFLRMRRFNFFVGMLTRIFHDIYFKKNKTSTKLPQGHFTPHIRFINGGSSSTTNGKTNSEPYLYFVTKQMIRTGGFRKGFTGGFQQLFQGENV